MIFHKDKKRFQSQLLWPVLISMLAFAAATASTKDQVLLKSCTKLSNIHIGFKVDLLQLKDVYFCLQGVVNLYRSTDVETVRKFISPEMEKVFQTVVSKVTAPNMAKVGLPAASLYLYIKTVQLYDRAKTLDINQKQYMSEFIMLRDTKLKPLARRIERMSSRVEAVDVVSMKELIVSLEQLLTELRTLTRTMHKDLKEATSGQTWSAAYGVLSTSACLGTLVVSGPLGLFSCGLGVASGVYNYQSHTSFGTTTEKLQELIHDVDSAISETGRLLVSIYNY